MDARLRVSLRTLVPAGLAWGLAMAARHLLIEPTVIAQRCDLAPDSGGCALRHLLIRSFAEQGLGWIALIAGAGALLCTLATLRAAHRGLVALAMTSGAAGLVLYCFEPAAVGVLLALVAAVRPPASRSQP